MEEVLRKNLKWLLDKYRLNPTSLAREMKNQGLNVAQPTIRRLLTGESATSNETLINNLATFFELSVADLRYIDFTGKGVPLTPTTTSSQITQKAQVPLISWKAVSNWTGLQDLDEEPEIWIPTLKKSGEGMFALKVRDDSMEPRFQAGDIVFVDTQAANDNGKIVIALKANKEAIMKQLISIDGEPFLKTINPDWPPDKRWIKVTNDIDIVGVVIAKWVDII